MKRIALPFLLAGLVGSLLFFGLTQAQAKTSPYPSSGMNGVTEPTATPTFTLTPQGSPTSTPTPSLTPIAYPGCNDEYEHNDHFGDPAMITSGQIVTAYICALNDNDYYGFELTAGSIVQVSLTKLPLDYDVQLYNPSFELMKTSNKPGTNPEIFTYDYIISPGIYRVRVYGFNSFTIESPYRLVVDFTSATPTPTPTQTPSPTPTNTPPTPSFPTATSTSTPTPTPTTAVLELPYKIYLPVVARDAAALRMEKVLIR